MQTLLAILVAACGLQLGTALAADGSTVAGDEESDREVIDRIDTKVKALTDSLTTLTNTVANFAARGHQIAVVEAIPRSLQVSRPTRANNVEFYLVGHSTIPGFPASGTVGPTGRFASYSVALPMGTYLFQLQQPYSDKLICQGSVSRLSGIGGGHGRGDCPRLFMIASDGTLPRKRFDDGFGVYTVTSSSGGLTLGYNFPADLTFTKTTDRPLTSYKGAVKITKLK